MGIGFPRVIAHRGFKTAAPENTIPAFALAISLGAPEIELDLWPSKDGDMVVCHDPDVARTTGCTGVLTEMSTKEIRRLDAGSWFSPVYKGVRIPLFEEVLELAAGRTMLNIHIKSMLDNKPRSERAAARNRAMKEALGPNGVLMPPLPVGIEEVFPEVEERPITLYDERDFERILELLDRYGCRGQAYITGDRDVLAVSRALAPDIPRCCLEGDRNFTIVEHAIEFGCSRVQFWKGYFTKAMVEKAHANGILCNMFWADDPDEARAYIDEGIDCILANDYQVVSQAVASE